MWRNAAGGGLRWTPRRPSTPPSHSPTHFIPPPRLPPLPPSLSSHPPPPSPVQHAHRPPLPPLGKSTAHPPPNHPTAQQQSHARSHPPGTWYGQYAAPAQRRPALLVRASTAPLSLPPPAAKWEASTPAAAAAAHPGRPRPPPPLQPTGDRAQELRGSGAAASSPPADPQRHKEGGCRGKGGGGGQRTPPKRSGRWGWPPLPPTVTPPRGCIPAAARATRHSVAPAARRDGKPQPAASIVRDGRHLRLMYGRPYRTEHHTRVTWHPSLQIFFGSPHPPSARTPCSSLVHPEGAPCRGTPTQRPSAPAGQWQWRHPRPSHALATARPCVPRRVAPAQRATRLSHPTPPLRHRRRVPSRAGAATARCGGGGSGGGWWWRRR